MVGGVCGGLAKYLDLEPNVVRLLFVVLALAQGAGVLLYIVLLIAIPEEEIRPAAPPAPAGAQPAPTAAAPLTLSEEPRTDDRRRLGLWAGALLIGLGAYLLVVNMGLLWWWNWTFAGPALLILAGVALLFWRLR